MTKMLLDASSKPTATVEVAHDSKVECVELTGDFVTVRQGTQKYTLYLGDSMLASRGTITLSLKGHISEHDTSTAEIDITPEPARPGKG